MDGIKRYSHDYWPLSPTGITLVLTFYWSSVSLIYPFFTVVETMQATSASIVFALETIRAARAMTKVQG